MKEHGEFGPIEVNEEELRLIKADCPRLYTEAEVRERERALLSVLRQCVEAIEYYHGVQRVEAIHPECPECTALAAARRYTEGGTP